MQTTPTTASEARPVNPPRRRVALIAALVMAGGLAIVASAVYSRYYGDPKRFAVVEAGILFRSAQPKPRQVEHVIDAHGVSTIIIAREGTSRNVPDEQVIAERSGATVVVIPIESREPIPDEQIQQFFDIVDNPARRPVLVHCSAGRHRTGLLCALYRIERQGWSVDQAMAEMLSFGFNRESQTVVEEQLRAYKPGRFARSVARSREQSAGGASP